MNALEKALKKNAWATAFIERWQYDTGKLMQFYELNLYLSRNREKVYDFKILSDMIGLTPTSDNYPEWKQKYEKNMAFLASEETKNHSYLIWLSILGLWSIFESCLVEVYYSFIDHGKFETALFQKDFPKAVVPTKISELKEFFKKQLTKTTGGKRLNWVEKYELWIKYVGLSSEIEGELLNKIQLIYALRNNFAHKAALVDKKVKSEIKKYYKGKMVYTKKLELDARDFNSLFYDLADYIVLMQTRVIRYFYAETEHQELLNEFKIERLSVLATKTKKETNKIISRIKHNLTKVEKSAEDKKERYYTLYLTTQKQKYVDLLAELQTKLANNAWGRSKP